MLQASKFAHTLGSINYSNYVLTFFRKYKKISVHEDLRATIVELGRDKKILFPSNCIVCGGDDPEFVYKAKLIQSEWSMMREAYRHFIETRAELKKVTSPKKKF